MLSWLASCRQSRTEPSFMTGEAAFGLGPLAILPPGKSLMHHPAIPSPGWARCVPRVDRNHRTADAKFTAAQHMVMFGVIGFVRQNPSRPQVDRCLPQCRCERRRILARATSRNRSGNQLRGGVKHGGQFGPSSMRPRATATASLKVSRGVPGLQSSGIDRRGVARIVGDQPAGSSPVTTSRQKSFKPLFSRSLCSACHSVE